jgi:hypothetical protein
VFTQGKARLQLKPPFDAAFLAEATHWIAKLSEASKTMTFGKPFAAVSESAFRRLGIPEM